MSLIIKNLHVQIAGKPILKGVNLTLRAGEVIALLGPNGSGKSVLAATLAGRDDILVTKGSVFLNKINLLKLAPEDRAREGLFIGWQYQPAISGVSTLMFLKAALNEQRLAVKKPPLKAKKFLELVGQSAMGLGITDLMLRRSLNEGFSGGEKKRNEILQMLILKPRVVILDEIDSGLDADALKLISQAINNFRSPQRSLLIISHHFRLLDYLQVDKVHIFADGKIIKSGDRQLAKKIEHSGYAGLAD